MNLDPQHWRPGDWFEHLLKNPPSQPLDPLSVQVRRGVLGRHSIVCAVFDFEVHGGSLGIDEGRRLVGALETACECAGAVVITRTGGIRVQEGVPALIQMPRLVAARQLLAQTKRPLIAVAIDPTMGGVAGSIVASADIIIAEPGARLALSGPRACRANAAVSVSVDTAESALTGGWIDMVIARNDLPNTLVRLFDSLAP